VVFGFKPFLLLPCMLAHTTKLPLTPQIVAFAVVQSKYACPRLSSSVSMHTPKPYQTLPHLGITNPQTMLPLFLVTTIALNLKLPPDRLTPWSNLCPFNSSNQSFLTHSTKILTRDPFISGLQCRMHLLVLEIWCTTTSLCWPHPRSSRDPAHCRRCIRVR